MNVQRSNRDTYDVNYVFSFHVQAFTHLLFPASSENTDMQLTAIQRIDEDSEWIPTLSPFKEVS